MMLFRLFLRQKGRCILYFFLSALILSVSFLLYGLPIKAVLYPSCLCALLGLGLLLGEFFRMRKDHKTMEELMNQSCQLLNHFPPERSIGEGDYKKLIYRLKEELAEQERKDTKRYWEALDYFTVWAHQIKTPLSAMTLRLQREDSDLSADLHTELLRVEQYADMVMAYLRLEEGSEDYVFRTVDLDALLSTSIKRFSSEFIARGLSLHYQPTGISLVTDEKWFSFVVEQLLSNAIKYTPLGEITIALEGDALLIRDTGIGIAPEDVPRVFDKGYTGNNGRLDKRASGLGLFLCKKVCTKLGLQISCQSRLSEGTTMILRPVRGENVTAL